MRDVPNDVTTYNFMVAEHHNYFVGEQRLWVHNCCDVSDLGHALTTHGSENTLFLSKRAVAMGIPNGQWTDDAMAADFLRVVRNGLPANFKSFSGELPKGFPARLVNPDGTYSQATRFTIAQRRGEITAFPEL